jgi:lysophospholipase L1-like esterase
MKSILCYGDSITWGYNPADGTRFPFSDRWPGILQAELGGSFRVIEEALPGRTTSIDSPYLPDRNGKKSLQLVLESHMPLDLFVLMLGTNDL